MCSWAGEGRGEGRLCWLEVWPEQGYAADAEAARCLPCPSIECLVSAARQSTCGQIPVLVMTLHQERTVIAQSSLYCTPQPSVVSQRDAGDKEMMGFGKVSDCEVPRPAWWVRLVHLLVGQCLL